MSRLPSCKLNAVQNTAICLSEIRDWLANFNLTILSRIYYRLKKVFLLWINPELTSLKFSGLFLSQFVGFCQFSLLADKQRQCWNYTTHNQFLQIFLPDSSRVSRNNNINRQTSVNPFVLVTLARFKKRLHNSTINTSYWLVYIIFTTNAVEINSQSYLTQTCPEQHNVPIGVLK
jgi:hypothetical protein